jgi:hypothetical protein
MPESRRHLLTTFFGAAGVLALRPFLHGLQAPAPATRPTTQAHPYPNGRDPNRAPDMEDPRTLDRKAIEIANQREIRSDVEKLYKMISDLKQQIEATDSANTLSLSVVKKAQEIEKLAKEIKNLAKG